MTLSRGSNKFVRSYELQEELCVFFSIGIFPNQDRVCYVGTECKLEDMKAMHLESGTRVRLLLGGCGSNGKEVFGLADGGIMSTLSLTDDLVTFFLSGLLPSMLRHVPRMPGN